jgi:hypothetical protein
MIPQESLIKLRIDKYNIPRPAQARPISDCSRGEGGQSHQPARQANQRGERRQQGGSQQNPSRAGALNFERNVLPFRRSDGRPAENPSEPGEGGAARSPARGWAEMVAASKPARTEAPKRKAVRPHTLFYDGSGEWGRYEPRPSQTVEQGGQRKRQESGGVTPD